MQSPAVSASKWRPSLQSAKSAAPWHSQSVWNAAAKNPKVTAKNPKAAGSDCVISRDEFLTGRVLSKQHPQAHLPGSYSLRTEANAIASPLVRPAPPPGLESPPGLELPDFDNSTNEAAAEKSEITPMPEKPKKQPVADSPPEVKEYKVFLQNVPEKMLKECMLRVMLEQGNLNDVTNLMFRPNGKVLITFASYASVQRCINHFHGRQWGGSVPVSANYVYTAPPAVKPGQQERQMAAAMEKAAAMTRAASAALVQAKSLQRGVPAFVPGSKLSAKAAVFVPSSEKIGSRDRFISDASTDAGPVSDGASEVCDSDAETQAAVCA